MSLSDQLHGLSFSLTFILPELFLLAGICLVLVLGLVFRKNPNTLVFVATFLVLIVSGISEAMNSAEHPTILFAGMLRHDDFSGFWKILADGGALITLLMTGRRKLERAAEYTLLILAIVLGAHVLVMSMNFIMVVLSMELISLCSYAMASWSFTKNSSEGSLKYFLFGSVATAFMIYGMSLLYGLAGTLDFSSEGFITHMMEARSPLLLVGGLMVLSGFLFKMAAAPMHFWAPDVYQSAPTPVVAFLSVVPKIAALAALTKFILAVNLFGQSGVDWTLLLGLVAALSIAVGNFSALGQSNPKRMLAYSSVAQAGFLLVGIVPITQSGVQATLFYGVILLIMNFLTFHALHQFERNGVVSIPSFAGLGRSGSLPSLALTVGLVSLVGLPVTAGFSAKLFVFSGIWEAYSQSHKILLIVLLVFGLFNTVVSLAYYLRIPYYLFLREASAPSRDKVKSSVSENLLSLILVILLLLLFFRPDLLMGWIIRVNFVL